MVSDAVGFLQSLVAALVISRVIQVGIMLYRTAVFVVAIYKERNEKQNFTEI